MTGQQHATIAAKGAQMPSFLLTSVVSTQQILDGAEVGQIATTGGIASGGATAIVMTGSATLMNLGLIMSNTTAISLASGATYSFLIGATGQVVSGTTAISGTGVARFTLQNDGTIMAAQRAVSVASTGNFMALVNSGHIMGATFGGNLIALALSGSGGRINLDNSGSITGTTGSALIDLSTTDFTVFSNTGVISNGGLGEAIQSRFGRLILENSGTIHGEIECNQGASITNTGSISSIFAFGSVTIINSGTIGFVTVGPTDTLFFDGRGGQVTRQINLRAGNDTLVVDDASIVISDPGDGIFGGTDLVRSTVSFELAAGLENLTLIGAGNTNGTGNSSNNVLNGNAGDNVLRGLAGNDAIFGGEGDNRLIGGTGNDVLRGGDGDDDVVGGTGNDTLIASGAGDTLLGGVGVDTLDLGLIQAGVSVNLGGKFATIASGGKFEILGLENILGTNFDDSLTGSDDDNVLSGDSGNDTLAGGIGNDSLFGDLGNDSLAGGAGNDTLRGGQGQDVLSGGPGTDVFVFGATSESAALTADQITGFAVGDLIDLAAIDAVAGGGDDAFVFVGTAAFAGTGPQIRFNQDAEVTTVEIRLSGSVANDLVIVLDGLVALTADSFLL